MTSRHHLAAFALWCGVNILCWPAVRAVAHLGWNDDRSIQILAAPLIAVFLIYYWERERIFREVKWSPLAGIAVLSVALALALGLAAAAAGPLAVVVGWMGVFVLCYGVRSFVAAWFPLCFLLLMIPVPAEAMDKISAGLQYPSAKMSGVILRAVGVPVFASETRLSLPGLELEVAPECSGIRSFLTLALAGLVAGRMALGRGWSRVALVLSVIPIAIFKNALRISVIALLSLYVDRTFLNGPVHRRGGLVFTPLGMLFLMGVLGGLRWCEGRIARRRG